ncbi:MAG: NADPH-dependent F420 reductase [Oceanicoccus sp.]|jgi:NADPH-dependent F420 reductase
MKFFKSIVATLFFGAMTTVWADTIAIIGSGNVATALGPQFAAQGHKIVYGSRDPSKESVVTLVANTGHGASATTPKEAAKDADIVVLAIPGMMVEQITRNLGDLSGKIIIDPTNPLAQSGKGFKHSVATSNAEIIQAAAPNAFVVKAFNTLSWKTMIEPAESGGAVSIPLVGNNEDAKNTVAQLVEGMGLEAIDLGGLENARWVEGMLMLWINNRYGGNGQAFDFHLRKLEK